MQGFFYENVPLTSTFFVVLLQQVLAHSGWKGG